MNLQEIISAKREISIRVVILLGLLSTIFLTYPLWITDRTFPLSAVINFPEIFRQNGFMIFLFFIGSAILLFFTNNRYIFISFLLLFVFLLLQDLNRLQTWTYVYILLLVSLFMYKENGRAVELIRLVLIGVYLWSGIHKFNQNFIHETGYPILTKIVGLDILLAKKIGAVVYIIPVIQVLLSIGLIWNRTRRIMMVATIVMHLIICCVFLPLIHSDNMEIIPWNISMIFLVFLSFYKCNHNLFTYLRIDFIRIVFCVVVFILPAVYYVNLWPHNMSFHLYSSRSRVFYVAISQQYWPMVERECHDYLVQLPSGTSGGVIIDMNRWSKKELNVMMFPEVYGYKRASYFFCEKGIPPGHIQLMSLNHGLDPTSLIKWSCGNR